MIQDEEVHKIILGKKMDNPPNPSCFDHNPQVVVQEHMEAKVKEMLEN